MPNPLNVKFKRGLHADLPTTSGATPGTFYLTTDTNRLYIGTDAGVAVELNKSITVVNALSDLPANVSTTSTVIKGNEVAKGQFYYVNTGSRSVTGNILAVCGGIDSNTGEIDWIQVNPDTNDNDHLNTVTITAGTPANGIIPYTFSFEIVNKANAVIATKTATLNIPAESIINVLDTKVEKNVDTTNNKVTVTTKLTDGTHNTTGSSFTIKGGQNVTVSEDSSTHEIVIDTGISTGSIKNKTTSTTNEVTQRIGVNNVNSGDKLVLQGENGIVINPVQTDLNEQGNSGAHQTLGKIGHTHGATTTTTPTNTIINGGSFNAVSAIATDANGHVDSIVTTTQTLPALAGGIITVDENDPSKLVNHIVDGNNLAYPTSDGPTNTSASILYHKITVDGTETTVKNQQSLGSFYSTTYIDNLMQGLDALTYKGVLRSANDVPDGTDHREDTPTPGADERVSNGDTYKYAPTSGTSPIQVDGQTVNPGDLIIATGTEVNGYLPANDITWTVVASGAETDTTYSIKVAAGGAGEDAKLGILASTANNVFTQAIGLKSDDWINIAPTAGVDSGDLTFSHANPQTATNTKGDNSSLTSPLTPGASVKIPQVSIDGKGHVSSLTEATLALPGQDTLDGDVTNKKIELKDANNVGHGSLQFHSGTSTPSDSQLITLEFTEPTETNSHLYIEHAVPANYTASDSPTATTAAPNLLDSTAANRQVTYVDGLTRDSRGHVLGWTLKTATFDSITLSSSVATPNNGVPTATISLKDSQNVVHSSVTISSPNETIAITGSTNAVMMDIVWGTFSSNNS